MGTMKAPVCNSIVERRLQTAAGLIVVMAGTVDRLGGGSDGYHCALAAVVISGVTLTILGVCRAGVLGLLMPSALVHGMLAAIGFIIIAKQIPVFLGFLGAPKEPLLIYAKTPDMVMHLNPEIALIGLMGLLIVIAYNVYLLQFPLFKRLPAPMVVVTVVAMSTFLILRSIWSSCHLHCLMR